MFWRGCFDRRRDQAPGLCDVGFVGRAFVDNAGKGADANAFNDAPPTPRAYRIHQMKWPYCAGFPARHERLDLTIDPQRAGDVIGGPQRQNGKRATGRFCRCGDIGDSAIAARDHDEICWQRKDAAKIGGFGRKAGDAVAGAAENGDDFGRAMAGIAGGLVPLALERFGFDPAIASSIFVTTFTDVGGFFSFLGLATVAVRVFGRTG